MKKFLNILYQIGISFGQAKAAAALARAGMHKECKALMIK